MAVAVHKAESVLGCEARQPIDKESGESLLDLARMAEHQMSMIETPRLRLDGLNQDAGRRLDVVAGSTHASQRPGASVIEQSPSPFQKEGVLSLGDFGPNLAAARAGTRKAGMPYPITVPPAFLMSLRKRDDEERSAVR
jgi:hypothetical protein